MRKFNIARLATALLAAVVLVFPAPNFVNAQKATVWKHVGGAPYAGTDSAAFFSAPSLTSSAKTHAWDLWAAGSESKVEIHRGTVLAAVNNAGGWTLKNAVCSWETPQVFPSLPAWEVQWQEGSVLYRVGKFSKDLHYQNCGNWYVIVEYRQPQSTPTAITRQPEPQTSNISLTVDVSGNGRFYNFQQNVTGSGSSATIGDVIIESYNTYPVNGTSSGGNDGGMDGLATDEHGRNGFVENAANAVYDYLDIYSGARYVGLSNDQIFRVGFVGADLKFWKGFGIFGEIGLGRDSQFRSGFPLPVRDEYRAFGLRVQYQKGLLTIQGKTSLTMVGDEIRMGSSKIGEFGTQAGESYQSAQTLMGVGGKIQFGPVFAEGGLAWGGDYISIANRPATVSSKSIALGISAKGLIETLKTVF